METVTIDKASKKYGFVVGETYPVLRNIACRCIVLMGTKKPNVVLSRRQLSRYGDVVGTPELSKNDCLVGLDEMLAGVK